MVGQFYFFRKIKIVLSIAIIVILYRIICKFHIQRVNRTSSSSSFVVSFSENEIEILINKTKLYNAKRIANVERVCRKYNLGKYKNKSKFSIYKEPPTPQYEIFFYDLKHKLSWCPIYKAGSSTWLYNLAVLQGVAEEEITNSKLQINDFVRKILPPLESSGAKRILQNSLKFVIVRHPLERILSAYRDKLENAAVRGKDGTHFFYKKYGSKIVAKYRRGNFTDTRKILKSGQYVWNNEEQPNGVEPTFKEFVRYLIDTDLRIRADDHWIPYYLFCTPCSLSYDVIGKVETMYQDQMLIIHNAQLQDKLVPNWRHKTNPYINNASDYNGISDIAKIYFSQLNKTDLEELYEKYKLDFELFQYNAKEYSNYVTV